MKFVLAPDKYKGSLDGSEFCNAAEEGIRLVYPNAEILKRPLADGGDGTLAVVKDYLNAADVQVAVHDPLFRKIRASYLFSASQKTAFIEMSEASGHRLLKPKERHCMETTSLGTGELVLDALEKGAKTIVLGIGGSATNDGGMGMAQALGYSFLDERGQSLSPIGKNLLHVHTIAPPKTPLPLDINIKIACDVSNPFYGPEGAAHVYAAQKGASHEEIDLLDRGLKQFSHVIQKEMGMDVQQVPGSGAAGGLGGGAVAFLDGTLTSGIDLIMELAHFDKSLEGAHWVITGEGRLDGQTLSGKTISGVLSAAKRVNVPVAAFCGSMDLTIAQQEVLGIDYATSILRDLQNLEEAMASSYDNLRMAVYNFCRTLQRASPPTV